MTATRPLWIFSTIALTLKQIGQVFRKFLKADRKITVNGQAVEPIDPLMLSDPNTTLMLETEIEVEAGGRVVLRVVELPDLGQAGNKDRGRQALITQAGNQGRARANTKRGQIDHSLAEGNITRRATLIPKPKSLVEERSARRKKESHAQGTGLRKRTPYVTDLKTISGLKVVFEEGNYGEGPFYHVRQEGRTIYVVYNREHPFWRELLEHATEPKVVATLDYLVFARANAELLVPDHARVVKENVNTTLVGLLV